MLKEPPKKAECEEFIKKNNKIMTSKLFN